MAVGSVSQGAKVYVDFLETFGVAKPELTKLKDKLFEANQLHIDGYGRVELRNLTRFAKQLGIEFPEPTLLSALQPSTRTPTKLTTLAGDFKAVTASSEAPRQHAERPGPVTLDAKSLGASGSAIQSFLNALHQSKQLPEAIDLAKGGIDSRQLAKLLEKHGFAAREHLTTAQIEAAKTTAYSATGPAYEERDAKLSLDSTFRALPTQGASHPDIKLYAKSGFEAFFLRRDTDGRSFTLHGFRKQSVVVSLPKGAQAVLIDAEGDQRGLRIPTKRQTIDGVALDTLEISPEHISASDKIPRKLDFTLRIIDKNGAPLMEERLAFDPQIGQRSEKLFQAKMGYPKKPSFGGGELEDEHFARFVPAPSQNSIPAGRRPSFELEGLGTFDRLLLTKDGKSFPIADWMQLGTPPKSQTQALKAEGGARVLLSHRSASESHLDHPDYRPDAGFSLRDSFGHAATFNRDLSMTNQAFWDHRGLRVIAGTKTFLVDPLTPG